jgi:CHAT domain-containing protein
MPLLHELLRLTQPSRPFLGRITGAHWSPLRDRSSVTGGVSAYELELEGKAGEILRRSERSRSPGILHAAGVATLLLGRPTDAVTRLESATRAASTDASIWSDLAAARLALATTRNEPQELPSALAAADHALRLDPRSPAARFNRALVLTQLGLRNEACDAWRSTLHDERDREWAAEARTNLDALSSSDDPPIVADLEQALDHGDLMALLGRRHEEVRAVTESVLVTGWADAFLAGNEVDASRRLAQLRAVADAIATNGDRYLHDIVLEIKQRNSPRELARALIAYRTSRFHYRDQFPDTDTELLGVANQFRQLHSPMTHIAAYYAASAAFERNRRERTREILERLLTEIDEVRYPTLAAASHKLLGMYYAFRGLWSKSLVHLERGRELYALHTEPNGAAFTSAIIGEVYDRVGQFDLGWRHRTAALRVLGATAPGERSVAVLAGAVHAEILRGQYENALSLASIARKQATRVCDPLLASELLVSEARAMLIARGASAAAQVIARGKAAARQIADPFKRQRVVAELAVAEGEIALRTNPHRTVALVTSAIEFYEDKDFRMFLPPSYLDRGRAHRATGNRAAALADLQAGLAELERQRENVAPDIRTTIFDTVPDLVAETVDLLLLAKREKEAYSVVERARARTLTEALGIPRRAGGEAAVEAIAASLPPHAVLIEYALLPRGIAAFCISRGGMKVVRFDINREVLRRHVDDLGVAIDSRETIGDVRRLASTLYTELIEPLEPQLGDAETLYVVPDRFLYATPFAALFDENRGEYLIQRRRIVIAPSGAFLLRRTRAGLATSPALIVSDPTDLRAGNWLPAARREAAAIARLYPGSLVLEGRNATIDRFVVAARRSALIHYAGHAGSDDGAGGFLPLAGVGNRDGRFDATSVSRLALRHTNLVVLSACATMRGSASRVEGMPSISRAFLTAGAPTVVGMLWEVEDETAAPLLLSFHQMLVRHRSASAALQAAQCALIHSPDAAVRHPASWAGAVVLGVD